MNTLRRFWVAVLLGVAIGALLAGCVPRQKQSRDLNEGRQAQAPVAVRTACDVALALPLSGPYGALGRKILAGARVAELSLAEQGITMTIHEIDTNKKGWVSALAQLPENVRMVGGPLRPDAYLDLALSKEHQKRAVFAFMQSLGDAGEGREAWRFFSSPYDQMRTQLVMANREFGISDFAVLYPNEPFGQRIAQLFQEEAERQGLNVSAVLSYPPENPLVWSDVVAALLYGNKDAPNQEPPFQAVFMPDSWAKVEMLVPYFFFHQKEHMLLLGSTLWGQTLSPQSNVQAHNFKTSVFPGVWWERNNVPATRDFMRYSQTLELGEGESAGFWQALGYDFIQFSSRVGELPLDWTPDLVNAKIRDAQRMDWSMAPIQWESTGRANQQMFLFTPTVGGLQPADLPSIRQRIQRAKQGR